MASSMLAAAAAAAATQASTVPAEDDECQDELNSSLRSCANEPDFAVICTFMQKFSKDLGLDLPNFRQLQEWLTNTDEVSDQLRDLHIKLLRKTRKTVHEKSWESALSKFCFGHSAQDAWEVERFGYKKSSLKVKLRIFRELLESQFERNGKFRAKLLQFSADSLRPQPIGRDRLGHSYWLTQDNDCNLRIYQEHLDEEIWQVVATNREEFVNLIARLRGNEVVLPSTDIGIVDEDTSSSNSCNAPIVKPPPPEEQDDSQEEEAKVPNLRIKLGATAATNKSVLAVGKGEEELAAEEDAKLKKKVIAKGQTEAAATAEEAESEEEDEEGEEEDDEEEEGEEEESEEEAMEPPKKVATKANHLKAVEEKTKANPAEETQKKVKPLFISQAKIAASSPSSTHDSKKRPIDDVDKSSPATEEFNMPKKLRPSLLDSNRAKKPSRYEDAKSDEEDDDDGEEGEEEEDDEEGEEEDMDSAAAEEDENEEKEIEDFDDDDEIGEAIEDPPGVVRGEGTGRECQDGVDSDFFHNYFDEMPTEVEPGPAIEEQMQYVYGEGRGEDCLVGNTKNAEAETSTETTPPAEPKATFFFGEPGCLKLSPMKQTPPKLDSNRESESSSAEKRIDEAVNEKCEADNNAREELLSRSCHLISAENKVSGETAAEEHRSADENGEQKSNEENAEEDKKLKANGNSEEETPIDKQESVSIEEEEIKNEIRIEQEDSIEAEREKPQLTDSNNINPNCSMSEKVVEVKEQNSEEGETSSIAHQNFDAAEERQQLEAKQETPKECIKDEPNLNPEVEIKEQSLEKIELNVQSEKEPDAAREEVSKKNSDVESKEDTKNDLGKELVAEQKEDSNSVFEKHMEQPKEILEAHESTPQEEPIIEPAEEPIIEPAADPKESLNQLIKCESEELKTESKNESEEIPKTESKGESSEIANEATESKLVLEAVAIENPTVQETIPAAKSTIETSQISTVVDTPLKTEESLLPSTSVNALNESSELNTPKPSVQPTITSAPQALPLTPPKVTTSSTASTLPNRKRRLVELAEILPQPARQSTSESELDVHSENPEDALPDDEFDAMDVGGKRLKMRPKLTNVDLRKKVEAHKVAVEETTSSSSEEDARRRRKIISPKRKEAKIPQAAAERNEEEPLIKQNKEEAPKVENNITLETRKGAILKSAATSTPAPIFPVATTVKHKPTLAEIIEKKLKKTPEKPPEKPSENVMEKTPVKPEEMPQLPTTSKITANASLENVTPSFPPPKKFPITKPLKKNLLTQLRQEESDEEAIPRKRTVGETVAASSIVGLQKMEPIDKPDPLPVTQRKTPERKTPERKTPERQRKRRSSEEVKHGGQTTDSDNKKEGLSEKHKKNNEEEMDTKPEVTKPTVEEIDLKPENKNIIAEEMESKAETKTIIEEMKCEEMAEVSKKEASPPAVGRRSSRRGAGLVIYAELPQPKRTRGGPAKVTPKKDEEKSVEKTLELKVAEVKKAPIETPKSEDNKLIASASIKTAAMSKKALAAEKKKETLAKIKEDSKAKEKPKAEEEPTIEETPEDKNNTKSPEVATNSDISPGVGRGKGGRKKREVDANNIIETTDAETPVRQSRRIAQQKIREEAERRKLEEIALRTMKQELKKKKKAEKEADPTVAEPTEESSSEEETSEVETKKKAKKKCPGKDGWSSGSEEQEEPEEEDEPPHYETDPGSPLFRSDHEFSPESDLEDESQVVPTKRARTARKEDAEEGEKGDEEEACQKCGKSDHPEWILLCDNCDKGYHCSCLSPVLFYIPEGDWYCPPCQQEQLILALERQLKEFDELVERKRIQEVEDKRLAEEAEIEEKARLEDEKKRKERKKQKHKNKRLGEGGQSGNSSEDSSSEDGENDKKKKEDGSESGDEDGADEKKLSKKSSGNKKDKGDDKNEKGKRRRGDGRSRRRVVSTRGARRRRRRRNASGSGSGSGSRSASSSGSGSGSSSDSSSATDSDDEPIYKLRKRRQINVSYRLNEYDDLINSALKKEMDEAAGAGNLGRGKDITTIIEADKEEKARQKQLEQDVDEDDTKEKKSEGEEKEEKEQAEDEDEEKPEGEGEGAKPPEKELDEEESDDEPLKRKAKSKPTLKKKPRKLTTLDISSEEDNASDEDFKTSSFDEEDEDTSISVSTDSDSSLEVYRRRGRGGKKKQRKAARRAARERRKDRKFVVDESDDDEEARRPKSKKKRKEDSDYTESETGDDDGSEVSENMDSADLCDDTSSDDSDGAWHPSKRKKQRKSNVTAARKSPKIKKPQVKKTKRVVEYSDDDISESEEEDDDDEDDGAGGKGSGKQPRSQPLKTGTSNKGKGKGKGKSPATKKKKKKPSEDEDSFSGSEDSTRRTRGRRYAYLEDFDDESSDGGIKPGVKRPDTPPEEREKFIKRQEEIKRMLAEKNAEGAKLAATPRLTPIKAAAGAGADKDKRSPAKPGDSLSTVPLSVIRQAKVLDIDYLQRKGEPVGDLENVDEVDEFDDADLPDDLPEDMDEETIARMVEEEEEFNAAAARELPAPDEVLRTPTKTKPKESAEKQPPLLNPSLAALSQMPGATSSGLQEPMRKRLPMPTMHPPLLRHQFPGQHAHSAGMIPPHLLQQRPSVPPTHLLQNALCAPLGQPLNRNFSHHQHSGAIQRMPPGMPPGGHVVSPLHLMPTRQPLPASQPLPGAAAVNTTDAASAGREPDHKPRGRRKKITPLRDPLQKQQAAAAATAAAHADKTEAPSTPTSTPPTTTVSSGGVIKSSASAAAASTLSIAQPPQLYKPPGAGGVETQPSVITRMPHLPPQLPPGASRPGAGGLPSSLYPGGEVPRYYGPPPPQQSRQSPAATAAAAAAVIAAQRGHRGHPPQQMPPHPGMRPTYGPPPPLRGQPTNHPQGPPTSAASAVRTPYGPGDQHGPMGGIYGGPPPARHSASLLNHYRPQLYGNPNYSPRGAPPGANLRPGAQPPGPEYAAGPRGYPPFGYYPPPPPLTTPHPHPPPTATAPPPSTTAAAPSAPSAVHTVTPTAAPSSVIVVAPPTVAPAVAVNHANAARAITAKSPPPSVVAANGKNVIAEPRKKLTTLEAYPANPTKSPLPIGNESSGSHSSPGIHAEGADDSSSTPTTSTAAVATAAGAEGQASEFSGLVSYFSSQHDDYNT